MDDEFKLTRKKYKTELQVVIRPEELKELLPFQDRLIKVFSDDMIRFADETGQWESIIRGSFPSLSPNWAIAKIFMLQTRYSLDQKKRKQEHQVVISVDEESISEQEQVPAAPPIERATRKSTNPIPPLRKCFIETSFGESQTVTSLFETPPQDSAWLEEVQSDLEDGSGSRKIVLMRCRCGFSDGSSGRCDCASLWGKYLVVAQVLRSRNVVGAELLVRYKPFIDKTEWPCSWIPMQILAQWRSGALLDYLLTRIRFPPP